MKILIQILVAGCLAATTFAPTVAAGDAVKGERVFRKCKACHSVEPGKKMMGPSLAGVVGRTSGAVEGFKYSPAMAEAGIVWTEENLAGYLQSPRTFMKGNRMAFAGLRKPEELADIIAYLKEQSGE